ncbi:MAG: transferase, partial [Rivularia sp. (in: cyanobacteria)]
PLTPSPRPYVSPSPISYFSPVKNSTEEKAVSSDSAAEKPTNVNSNGVGNHIYGRTNIKSLLITLFPHRQSLDTPVSEEQQSEDG